MAMDVGYRYLGNYSAVDPAYSRGMSCDDCKVSWTGCWDNFQCPLCGQGELPSAEPKIIQLRPNQKVTIELPKGAGKFGTLQKNLQELQRLHGELRGILDELEEAVR